MLQASASAGKYSIGVDIDQCDVAPGHVMASMLKRGDVAVFNLVKDLVDGKPIEPGSVHTYDLKPGVELAVPAVTGYIPAEVKERVEALKAEVVAGKIEVPTVK